MFDVIIIFIILFSLTISFFRGFIKEIFGLIGIITSILLTIHYHDYFFEKFHAYIESTILSNISSTITVFVIITITIIIINSWVMYLLSPIRLGVIDRFSGLFIGALRGILFSYLLFFIIKVSSYTLATDLSKNNVNPKSNHNQEKKVSEKTILPHWFVNSYSYNVLQAIDMHINNILPDSIHDQIKVLGENIQDILNKQDNKQKKNSQKSTKS